MISDANFNLHVTPVLQGTRKPAIREASESLEFQLQGSTYYNVRRSFFVLAMQISYKRNNARAP